MGLIFIGIGGNKMKDKKKILLINPPPSDERCECCNKHISELKPFGGPGDPLVGDFTGVLLKKNFRGMVAHGTHKKFSGEEALDIKQMENTISASWECRDCYVLETKEYLEKQKEIYESLNRKE